MYRTVNNHWSTWPFEILTSYILMWQYLTHNEAHSLSSIISKGSKIAIISILSGKFLVRYESYWWCFITYHWHTFCWALLLNILWRLNVNHIMTFETLSLQHINECLSWQLNVGHQLHLFLALCLSIQQFHSSCHVSPILKKEKRTCQWHDKACTSMFGLFVT